MINGCFNNPVFLGASQIDNSSLKEYVNNVLLQINIEAGSEGFNSSDESVIFKSCQDLLFNLNQLFCESAGDVKIELFNDFWQLHLCFSSETIRQAILEVLSTHFKASHLPFKFDSWQISEHEGAF